MWSGVGAQCRGLAELSPVCFPAVDLLSDIQVCSLVTYMDSWCPAWQHELLLPQLSCGLLPQWMGLLATRAVDFTPPFTSDTIIVIELAYFLGAPGTDKNPLWQVLYSHKTKIVPAMISQFQKIGNRWMHRHRSTQGSNGDSSGQHAGGRSRHTNHQTAVKCFSVAFNILDLKGRWAVGLHGSLKGTGTIAGEHKRRRRRSASPMHTLQDLSP